jgi:hypothetical protein
MIDKPEAANDVEVDTVYGHAGKNGNWPGCTTEFVKRTLKRRKKNKLAKASRKKNRR